MNATNTKDHKGRLRQAISDKAGLSPGTTTDRGGRWPHLGAWLLRALSWVVGALLGGAIGIGTGLLLQIVGVPKPVSAIIGGDVAFLGTVASVIVALYCVEYVAMRR